MIDPKFDKIPDKPGAKPNDRSATGLQETERTPEAATPRQGLSINDTVAANANLSSGGRGADVSGVRAGAGAGAGSTFVTPGSGHDSPAPTIAPGPKGSGTTPISDGSIEQTTRETRESPVTSSERRVMSSNPSHDEIASHAYRCWHERGCPEGSPEVDWDQAETDLRTSQTGLRHTSPSKL